MIEFNKYSDWYIQANNKIKALYGSDHKLFAGLLSSTSPRSQLSKNVRVSKLLFNASFKRDLLNEIKTDLNSFKQEFNLMQCHINNVKRCLNNDFNLSGSKVNRFYQNLTGNETVITIDVWMLRYLEYNQILTNNRYKQLEQVLIDQSKLTAFSPAGYQAVIWTQTRFNYGFKPITIEQYLN